MNQYFEKLFKGSRKELLKTVEDKLISGNKMFIVTANPEIFMTANKDESVHSLLSDSEVTVVADGIGIVKGSQILDLPVKERIPGVEIAEELFKIADKNNLSIFLFGANKAVLDALCDVINAKYNGIKLAGAVDGYVTDKDAVFEQIKSLSPDIIMVALGVPAQEKLIYKHYGDFDKGLFIGVGGSFDVLSGTKARAPQFFIKHNIEWLYRILKEPKRIKRFYNNNVKFLLRLNSCKK